VIQISIAEKAYWCGTKSDAVMEKRCGYDSERRCRNRIGEKLMDTEIVSFKY